MTRLHHLALRVADLEKCREFYSDILGLPEIKRGDHSIWLRAGDLVLMLESRLRGVGPDAGSGHLLAFAAGDLGRWEKRLLDAGIPIDDRTPTTIYVRDPEGHRVGLSAYSLP